ncbi:hypothetical protein D1007_15708 [Hordeum vulgare]|nr:hypothetical protein D1007_15708 [Hordeum vulgare]
MHRFLRRTRSAELDALASDPFAPASSAVAAPRPPAPAPSRAPPAALGKTAVELARSSSTPAPTVAPPPVGILRTAGSVAVPRLALGRSDRGLVPSLSLGASDAGPSSSSTDLPPSIAHYFNNKLQLESGNYSRWRQLFYLIACKHELQHHLDIAAEPLAQSAL